MTKGEKILFYMASVFGSFSMVVTLIVAFSDMGAMLFLFTALLGLYFHKELIRLGHGHFESKYEDYYESGFAKDLNRLIFILLFPYYCALVAWASFKFLVYLGYIQL